MWKGEIKKACTVYALGDGDQDHLNVERWRDARSASVCIREKERERE